MQEIRNLLILSSDVESGSNVRSLLDPNLYRVTESPVPKSGALVLDHTAVDLVALCFPQGFQPVDEGTGYTISALRKPTLCVTYNSSDDPTKSRETRWWIWR